MGGGTRSEPISGKVRLGTLNYALALMRSAVNGDSTSWAHYYTAQYARFKAYGMSQEELSKVMASLTAEAEVEFPGFAYSLGSSILDLMDASERSQMAILR